MEAKLTILALFFGGITWSVVQTGHKLSRSCHQWSPSILKCNLKEKGTERVDCLIETENPEIALRVCTFYDRESTVPPYFKGRITLLKELS